MSNDPESSSEMMVPVARWWRITVAIVMYLLGAAVTGMVLFIVCANVRRAQIQQNESTAIGDLRTVTGAEVGYNSAHGVYTTEFEDLLRPYAFLDGDWSKPRNGFEFTLTGDTDCFELVAYPQKPGLTGARGFYTDCSGVIRSNVVCRPMGSD